MLGLLSLWIRPCAAQTVPADSAGRDALFLCAVRLATAAGFQPVPRQPPGRVVLMRPHASPGTSSLLDALKVSVAAADSTGRRPLEVRAGSFVVSRGAAVTQREVPPRASLLALADSIRAQCH